MATGRVGAARRRAPVRAAIAALLLALGLLATLLVPAGGEGARAAPQSGWPHQGQDSDGGAPDPADRDQPADGGAADGGSNARPGAADGGSGPDGGPAVETGGSGEFLATAAPPLPDGGAAASAGELVEAIVEQVEEGGETTPLQPAPPSAGRPLERLEANGWARQRFDLLLPEGSSAALPAAVPRDRLASRTAGFARLRYRRGQSFELAASGALAVDTFLRGRDGSLSDDLGEGQGRGSYSASLHELYLGYFTRSFDLRVGQQRVAWGRSDMASPNDVLNARDQRDPLLAETEVFHLPTPLVRADWHHPRLSVQGVLAPVFVPDRFDMWGSNWAFIQPGAPAGIRGLYGLMASLVDRSLADPYNRLVQQTRLPSPSWRNLSGGARVAFTGDGLDLAGYYHYGFDRTPFISVDAVQAQALLQLDFSQARPSDLGLLFDSLSLGASPIRIQYTRRHHLGLDGGTVVGPVGLRLDAALQSRRVFFTRALTGAASKTLHAVASAEYQTGDVDKVFLLEGGLVWPLDLDDQPLLFQSEATWMASGVVRLPLLRALRGELRLFATLGPWTTIVRAQLGWKWSSRFVLEAGAVWLEGAPSGLGGYFGHNTAAFLTARHAF